MKSKSKKILGIIFLFLIILPIIAFFVLSLPPFGGKISGERLERVKANFLIKKLGLADGPALKEGINKAIDTYGKSERNKYRAVFYYLLTKHFGKESVYG